MKIMQLCFSPVVNSAGGAEKVFCNTANHFVENYEVVNICCDNEEGKPFYELDDRVSFINICGEIYLNIPKKIKVASEILRVFKKIGFKFTLPKVKYRRNVIGQRLQSILDKERPDIIVCYELDSAMALKKLGFPRDKIVVMYHNKIEYFLQMMTKEEKEFLKSVRYNQVLLSSDKIELDAEGFENVVCIGNIVPKIDIPKNNKREKTIIHVGRLDKIQKRQHLAIEAFSKIAAKYPEWTMKFIGGNSNPPSYYEELHSLIKKHGLEKQVILAGTTSKVTEELLKASIFIFPSAYEGFGLAMTEAMSAGLPVIGFKNTPAVNELVIDGENGILCDDNSEAFAKAMSKLISDTELREYLGQKAVASIGKYSSDAVFNQWEEVFRRMSV